MASVALEFMETWLIWTQMRHLVVKLDPNTVAALRL